MMLLPKNSLQVRFTIRYTIASKLGTPICQLLSRGFSIFEGKLPLQRCSLLCLFLLTTAPLFFTLLTLGLEGTLISGHLFRGQVYFKWSISSGQYPKNQPHLKHQVFNGVFRLAVLSIKNP